MLPFGSVSARAASMSDVRLPVRHPNERRQIPLVVQADVHLHRPLRPPELRPRKRRQTQVNGCRIHREQLGFEPVAMSRRLRLAAPQQSPVQLLVHLPRLLGVHPRERRPRHHADPQVVELARLCGKIRDDVPQAAASCQLGHPHRHELAPAGHAPRHPTRLVLACEALELMSRYELEYLREYGIIVGHGLGSPCVFRLVLPNPSYQHRVCQARSHLALVGQQ